MQRIGNRILAGALVAWLLALVSCGSLPTAPMTGPAPGAASGVASGAATDDTAGPGLIGVIERVIAPIKALPRPIGEDGLEVSQPVSGGTATTIEIADVMVHVPAGAIQGNAEIKVTIPDSTKLECRLDIYPPEKNGFDVPVKLEFNLSPGQDPRLMTVFWFDEVNGGWVAIPTTVDAASRRVSAELPHFSIYKADLEVQGRAGW